MVRANAGCRLLTHPPCEFSVGKRINVAFYAFGAEAGGDQLMTFYTGHLNVG